MVATTVRMIGVDVTTVSQSVLGFSGSAGCGAGVVGWLMGASFAVRGGRDGLRIVRHSRGRRNEPPCPPGRQGDVPRRGARVGLAAPLPE